MRDPINVGSPAKQSLPALIEGLVMIVMATCHILADMVQDQGDDLWWYADAAHAGRRGAAQVVRRRWLQL